MAVLAIKGGKKTRESLFPKHPIIGDEEKKQVLEVLESGNISTFIASPGENFLGGKKIKEFEEKFSKKIGTKFGVAFNSASSALHAAVVAVGVKPGEEIIVPPTTFTSTATCALMHNAIPVFCDVKEDIYCIDPNKIEKLITPLTKAIIPVHLFGHPCDIDEIITIAEKHKLKVIEDCAQALGAEYKDKTVGTFGDCSIFSFQESKTIMTGEGGMLLTDSEEIANIARMVRNHGEVILPTMKQRSYRTEFLGWGYRMTELEAALGIAQIEKLDTLNAQRITLGNFLSDEINKISGMSHVKYDNVKHVYWMFGFTYDEKIIGIPRNLFCDALRQEGIPCFAGYVEPLHLNPIYTEKRAFAFKHYEGNAKYGKGVCPIAENLHEKLLINTIICRPPATIDDMKDVIRAIHKIIDNKGELLK
ncbi:DegT/DnrJ/EryC1/StrS family aminotransferase [Nitrosopumilus sp. b1]|uniref:DegT/DnrJ/EryC1/StrS family aminotransferase n=1 Tax=Nitrosopumilus sp. b1 TaxID=2109907 RepID=UPI0015F76BD0|nr:DegT/DnrJ/EryC1/StrS family aminotransferase [Nitrosopumilus sp. b1]KAF6243998.1 DegT/DnrJ/EryC1/StrS family aminotransferase [Nitrosopumilus sp. b1]